MPAAFPGALVTFATHHNLTDIVDAADPNNIQNEVVAVETTLGTNPHVGVIQSAGSYVTSNRTFASVAARVANLEHGLVADTHTQYIHNTGGDTIQSGAVGTTTLTLKRVASQTAPLLSVVDQSNNPLASVDSSGNFSGVAVTGTSSVSGPTVTATGANGLQSVTTGTPKVVLNKSGTGAAQMALSSDASTFQFTDNTGSTYKALQALRAILQGTATGATVLDVQAAVGQSANIFVARDGAGNPLAWIDSGGNIHATNFAGAVDDLQALYWMSI